MIKEIYEFDDLPATVKKDIITRKIKEIIENCQLIGYVDALPSDHYIRRAVLQAEEMHTPWFIAEYLYEYGKDEIISEIKESKYDYLGRMICQEDEASEDYVYVLQFIENECCHTPLLCGSADEALNLRKTQVSEYCRRFEENFCETKDLMDIDQPFYINRYAGTCWTIFKCKVPHEQKNYAHQYFQLRECFNRLIRDVLGENYYNEGMDVSTTDRIACEDIKNRLQSSKFFRRNRAGK